MKWLQAFVNVSSLLTKISTHNFTLTYSALPYSQLPSQPYTHTHHYYWWRQVTHSIALSFFLKLFYSHTNIYSNTQTHTHTPARASAEVAIFSEYVLLFIQKTLLKNFQILSSPPSKPRCEPLHVGACSILIESKSFRAASVGLQLLCLTYIELHQ